MTVEEIAAQVAEVELIVVPEKYEDNSQFVGAINGEKHSYMPSLAVALAEACAKTSSGCCGIACDSDCGCS